MAQVNCIIIEDQPPAQRILKRYIQDVASLNLKAVFSNAVESMQILNSGEVDLVFLDIHLPKISGIDFLKSLNKPPKIILTTAFPDYALEAYDLNVSDYLLKPFSFQRFLKAVTRATQNNSASGEQHTMNNPEISDLFVKSGHDIVRILIDDIIYIKSDADYTEVHLESKRQLSSEPLRYWISVLDEKRFCRIHRSYIINLSRIEKISGNQLYMKSNIQLPIGRSFKDEFLNKLNKI